MSKGRGVLEWPRLLGPLNLSYSGIIMGASSDEAPANSWKREMGLLVLSIGSSNCFDDLQPRLLILLMFDRGNL